MFAVDYPNPTRAVKRGVMALFYESRHPRLAFVAVFGAHFIASADKATAQA
ncbi:hypothetical protein MUO32_26045 [Shinella sp. CPCC 101442]|jgi:hypothetical protein|uniref:hypothetical protein n=1 Tax=unclassified Shinella TaxID=2643062 RepID=UPI0021536521|nr:hypothetical protein [Shinella sp. CPCC 101442]MCR6502494.1 hypothetical protein [Shinella sp. CPCC 101442]